MRRRLIVRPEAELDIQHAYEWYEDCRPGLGEEFLLSLDAVFSLIERAPMAQAMLYKQVRRALLKRFPYGAFYILDRGKIVVIAILHARRNPKIWQNRLN